MDTLRQAYNRGQMMDDQLETQHFEQFYDCYHEYVRLTSCLPIYVVFLC
jgi:hypothetical protein